MSVAKKSHSISDFRQRIVLLHRKIIEKHDGEMEEVYEEKESVWAKIEPITGVVRNNPNLWHNLEMQKIEGMFKIIMRNMDDKTARNAYLNALRWNHKILDILVPFQIYENGKWLEGIAVEYRKETKDG
jgi:head-tail adaptor